MVGRVVVSVRLGGVWCGVLMVDVVYGMVGRVVYGVVYRFVRSVRRVLEWCMGWWLGGVWSGSEW